MLTSVRRMRISHRTWTWPELTTTLPHMNTEQFRTFLVAAEEGTAAAAAVRLDRSQSAVSRELAAFEEVLG